MTGRLQGEEPRVPVQQSLDRARATFAADCIEEAKKDLSPDRAETYRGLAEKLPAMIQTNGLGATLGFLAAKGADRKESDPVKPEQMLYEHLSRWLTRSDPPRGAYAHEEEAPAERLALLHRVSTGSGSAYRRASVEIMAVAAWMKRLAVAAIPKKGEG